MMRTAQRGIIVVVQVADRHSIQECGLFAGNFRADSDDRRLGISSLHCGDFLSDTDGGRINRAQGAAQRIEKNSLCLLDNLWRQVFIAKFRHPVPNVFRHGRPALALEESKRAHARNFQKVTP